MAKNNFELRYCIENETYDGDEIVEIGKVVELPSEEDILFVYYDKNFFEKYNYHFSIFASETIDGKEYPIAITDDLHRKIMLDKPDVFLALCMHEYGHYKNGDITNKELGSNKAILIRRYRDITNGIIAGEEAAADVYAAKCLGKPSVIRALDYLISARKKRNDPGAAIAIKEFELRKKALIKAQIN